MKENAAMPAPPVSSKVRNAGGAKEEEDGEEEKDDEDVEEVDGEVTARRIS